jgi:hypothetical protein
MLHTFQGLMLSFCQTVAVCAVRMKVNSFKKLRVSICPAANSIMGIITMDTTSPIFMKIHLNIMALEATSPLYHGRHANRSKHFV